VADATLLQQILVVMLGGSLGAAARFIIGAQVASWKWYEFPWGTLFVNLVGCFLMGVLYVASQKEMPQLLKVGIGIGFLGSLTTFSTFGLDVLLIWKRGHADLALLYLLASLGFGISLVAAGITVGQWWLGAINQPMST
tara:strand:- start:124 stop:540 length:417 start_codon:yes stop_codon:yes gene_type:complete